MTKEQDFKHHFATVLRDLRQDGARDPGAMMLLGSLAADLATEMNASTWSRAKDGMTANAYDALLQKLQEEGNAHHAAGRAAHAYVIQAIAVSLIARTQGNDPDMLAGDRLLDGLIDRAIVLYRNQRRPA